MIAETPEPPYYAVIFTSQHTGAEKEEYEQTSARMVELAKQQPGFISFDSVRNEAGVGITTVVLRPPS